MRPAVRVGDAATGGDPGHRHQLAPGTRTPLSEKPTVPPDGFGATVAVKTTRLPGSAGFADETRLVTVVSVTSHATACTLPPDVDAPPATMAPLAAPTTLRWPPRVPRSIITGEAAPRS